MNPQQPQAKAMLIENGVIKKLWNKGGTDEIIVEAGSDTPVIDAKGQLMLPGFIDTHNHLIMYAQNKNEANCSASNCESIQDIQQKLIEQKRMTSPSDWVIGWGYDDTLLKENRHPVREELDDVIPHQPAIIKHISGHFMVANTKALEAAGITETEEDPQGGHFGRYSNGILNGILHEVGAIQRLVAYLPEKSEDILLEELKAGAKDYIREGITTSTEAAVGIFSAKKELPLLVQALEEGHLPFDLRLMIMEDALQFEGKDYKDDVKALDQLLKNKSNGRMGIDSVKFFQDGSIQLRTAALSDPYIGTTEHGMLVFEQEDFNKKVRKYHDQKVRVSSHGNGDQAIHSILEAYKKAQDENPHPHANHRVEHAQTIQDIDLELAAAYNFPLSFFINHIYYWGDRHRDIFLGKQRAEQMNPLRKAEKFGILFTLHSDCPITPISPLFSIWAACCRQTRNGDVLGENQCLSVEKAVETMTIDGARLNGEENMKGSLAPGKIADFITLDKNIFEADPMQIRDASVTATWKNGQLIYEKEKTFETL